MCYEYLLSLSIQFAYISVLFTDPMRKLNCNQILVQLITDDDILFDVEDNIEYFQTIVDN